MFHISTLWGQIENRPLNGVVTFCSLVHRVPFVNVKERDPIKKIVEMSYCLEFPGTLCRESRLQVFEY
jgi:hypothetical protein